MRHVPPLLSETMLVVVAVISLGCTGDGPTGEPHPPGDSRHIPPPPLAEADGLRYYSGMATRQRLVVGDAATWAGVWAQMVGHLRPAPDAPVVDFAGKLVIVAAMGTRNTGGYSIAVTDVRLVGNDASISVREESPGSGCGVTAALTAPVAVVVVPRFTGHARFLEQTSERACR